MKLFCLVLFALAAVVASAQEMMAPPSPEFKKLGFMVGTWKGTETMSGMGGPSMKMDGTVTIKVSLGLWLEASHKSSMNGKPAFEGRQMTTYNPQTKKWTAIWFDSAAPFSMEMTGGFDGKKLTLVSKPETVPGMPGKVVTRATWTKLSDRELHMKVEMQSGGKWADVVVATYKKA